MKNERVLKKFFYSYEWNQAHAMTGSKENSKQYKFIWIEGILK